MLCVEREHRQPVIRVCARKYCKVLLAVQLVTDRRADGSAQIACPQLLAGLGIVGSGAVKHEVSSGSDSSAPAEAARFFHAPPFFVCGRVPRDEETAAGFGLIFGTFGFVWNAQRDTQRGTEASATTPAEGTVPADGQLLALRP